ncbi:MAG: NADH-quinone oxidoreductase subunit L [Acidobacteria bacterium]|nr:NADH-quinone oxidoreductase subunit L [Acidobacteriota bacterium]
MNQISLHLWLIPILPLLGAAINGLCGGRLSRHAVAAIGVAFCGTAFLLVLFVLSHFFALQLPHIETYGTWLRAGAFHADYGFYLDELSMIMLLVVTGVGLLIHIYSVGYMWEEGGFHRFFCYLNLFMFFMLVLVLAHNYLVMFIGWEGVGLASYLLIGFWFTRDSAASAGKKAFIVNRIGDFGFLIALFLLIKHFGSLTFSEVFGSISHLPSETAGAGLLTTVSILLLLGATGKSAQIPLYVWLPDAMEGPTPVSALIHAATMVTAGVYMVARSHAIFDRSPTTLTVVAVIGTLTAFYAATIAIAQTDIKKVLAYSTISQLGYMFLACGVAAYSAAIFHLMTHAFFKGLLFLAAGSVIHAIGGEQDMHRMGGLRRMTPWTFWTMTAATFAITGVPGFAGFFSKDEILWQASRVNMALWGLGEFTAFLTSFYMFRLWFLTFFGHYRGTTTSINEGDKAGQGPGLLAINKSRTGPVAEPEHHPIHESPKVMLIPLIILAMLSVAGGWVNIGKNFEKFLEPVFRAGPTAYTLTETATQAGKTIGGATRTELLFTLTSVLAAALGFLLALLLYKIQPDLPARIAASLRGLYTAVLNKYYVDELFSILLVKPLLAGSRKILWQGVDRRIIDAAVNDTAEGARRVSDSLRHMQSGNLRSYAGWVALGAAVVIAYMIWVALA